ncbi:MAG: lycopene cyclase family protein [Arenicella sp.]|jgi:lycopene beta-cyclase|nr:lycopene cyclase family protein [Arenicella sp.]
MPTHKGHEPETIDLIVIGAGCAGLSLAGELCKYEQNGEAPPKTLLIEPRSSYTTDRSWCYWEPTTLASPNDVDASWPSWSFSDSKQTFVHTLAQKWHYQYLNSGRFYRQRLAAINESHRVSVNLGESVQDVSQHNNGFRVRTNKAEYHCLKIVDTRPPTRKRLEQSLMLQIFYGIEIEIPGSHSIDLRLAKVMSDMRSDKLGFKFNYVLPLSPRSLLVEITRFTDRLIEPDDLRHETYQLACDIVGSTQLSIIREERGIVPMGLPMRHATLSPNPNISNRVLVGLGGGAARPATGYAFQRLQRWAHDCAQRLMEAGTLVTMQPDSRLVQWMDRVFLLTLKNNPQLGPKLFIALARRVRPVRLVRFLTDQATVFDLIAIIAALPVTPLLLTAFRDTKNQLVSLTGNPKCSTT